MSGERERRYLRKLSGRVNVSERDVPRSRGVTFYVHVTRRAPVGSPRVSSGVSDPARGNERESIGLC